MKNRILKTLGFFTFPAVILFTAASCNKKKDESELITTVELQLKKNSISHGTYIWKDSDGPGGANPQLPDTIFLDSGAAYTCSVAFKNESGSTSTDITQEVRDEGADHFICFSATPPIVQITHTDSDGKFSIGLESGWTALNRGNSRVRLVLRHQPNGVKDGTCDPGESDVDVEFPVVIK